MADLDLCLSAAQLPIRGTSARLSLRSSRVGSHLQAALRESAHRSGSALSYSSTACRVMVPSKPKWRNLAVDQKAKDVAHARRNVNPQAGSEAKPLPTAS